MKIVDLKILPQVALQWLALLPKFYENRPKIFNHYVENAHRSAHRNFISSYRVIFPFANHHKVLKATGLLTYAAVSR
jgi:hypothetical protein